MKKVQPIASRASLRNAGRSNGVGTDQITFTDRLRINFGWVLDPAIELLFRLGVHPNQLTFFGVLGSTAAGILASQGVFSWAGLVLLLTGPVDALDGALARRRGEAQNFGAFVDSVMDRYSELALYAGLLWVANEQGEVPFIMAVYFAAFGSMLVSYVRARAQSLGFESKGGLFSRVERWLILVFCLLLSQPLLGAGLIAIGANLTALQRIWWVRRNSRVGKCKPTINNLVDTVDDSLKSQNWYAALFLALTLPDICSSLEFGKSNGSRYSKWFEINLPQYKGYLSGDDCYALRCAVLHEAKDNITDQKKKDILEHFIFMTRGPHCNRFENIAFGAGRAESFLQLNVQVFCDDLSEATRDWMAAAMNNPLIKGRLNDTIEIHEPGYTYKRATFI